jgi:hypothetical protein
MNTIKKLLIAVLAIVATVGIANANTIITLAEPVVGYQQQENSPCIFGEHSCKNPANFSETMLPNQGNVSKYDQDSNLYTVGLIRSIVGNSFYVGVDISQNNEVQKLILFNMSINGNIDFTTNFSGPVNVPPTSIGGNGNGWADYILVGFDLTDYAATDPVKFHVTMDPVSPSTEQFFLISTNNPGQVPEPTSLLLLGTGMMALGLASIRRKSKR